MVMAGVAVVMFVLIMPGMVMIMTAAVAVISMHAAPQ
jgi:hypothetical protein